jgi:hypothetical protein
LSRPGLVIDGWRIFSGGARYARALLPFRIDSGVRDLAYAEAESSPELVLATLTWLAILALVALIIARKWRTECKLLLWIGGAIAPVLHADELLVPGSEGKIPLAERWLAHAVAPTALLVVGLLLRFTRPGRERLKNVFLVVTVLWSGLALAVTPALHGYYKDSFALMALTEEHYQEVPAQFRTEADVCRHDSRVVATAVQRGDTDAVVTTIGSMTPACRQDEINQMNLLTALDNAGRWQEASAVAAELSRNPGLTRRNYPVVLHLLGRGLLHVGDYRGALVQLRHAGELGISQCSFYRDIAVAEKQAGDPARATAYQQKAAACAR